MNKLIIVSAARNQGKTTRLWEIYRELMQNDENSIGGYITVLSEGNDKSRVILKDLQSGENMLLGSSHKEDWNDQEENWFQMGLRYSFSQESFDKTYKDYIESLTCSHLFIDEAGPLELKDRGFAPVLNYLKENFKGTLIVAVRDIFVNDFLRIFSFEENWSLEISPVPGDLNLI